MYREVKPGDKIEILPPSGWGSNWLGIIEILDKYYIRMLNPKHKDYNVGIGHVGMLYGGMYNAFPKHKYNVGWRFANQNIRKAPALL